MPGERSDWSPCIHSVGIRVEWRRSMPAHSRHHTHSVCVCVMQCYWLLVLWAADDWSGGVVCGCSHVVVLWAVPAGHTRR